MVVLNNDSSYVVNSVFTFCSSAETSNSSPTIIFAIYFVITYFFSNKFILKK